VTNLPHNKYVIGCRRRYKIKRKDDKSIDRYKDTLVAKRYTQLEGLEFFYTFCPIAKLTIFRLSLLAANVNN